MPALFFYILFLKSLFSRLGLLNGNQFTSRRQQVEAVGLIHYLATGRTSAEEYELALAKILCAFSLEEPLDLPESYPPEYLQEADDLLAAAIAQWSILKNTSIDGLRESFLLRGGNYSQPMATSGCRWRKTRLTYCWTICPGTWG